MPRDFRVYCEWNGEETHLSLAVWHDGFPKLKPEDRQTLATRLVDRMLGAATAKRTPHTVTVLEKAPAADAEGVVAGDELYTTLVEFLKSENFDAVTPPEMVEELRRRAKEADRTMAAEIRRAIRKHLEAT